MSETGPTFEEVALRQGLVTPEQVEEARRVREKVAADGLEVSVEEILLKKNYLTKPQAAAVHAAMGKGNKTAIEGYELLGKLGQGGMGAVYKARQTSMDRVVAVKILLPKFAKDKDGVERFLREARAVAKLNHPNIVSGIDAGVSNGIYYYVMEFVDGETLSQALAKRKSIPWKEALGILNQVAAALDHAHRNGLIHRDVKPGNVLLAKDGTVKLMDLGMARFAAHGNMDLTHSGQIMGTPLYMSPEQARGEELDIRTDLYALGISLYEMLTGKPPFTGDTPLVVLNKQIHEPLPFEVEGVPPGLLAVGRRLTEKDRNRRHPTPGELLKDLEAVEAGRLVVAPTPAPQPLSATRRTRVVRPRQKSQAPLLVGVAAGALVLAGVLALLLTGRREPALVVVAPVPRKTAPTPAAEDAKPLNEADRAALAGLTAARAYEKNNSDDAEEIAALYAALVPKAVKTPYEDRVRQRAEETRAFLAIAIEKRKKSVGQELQAGNALDVLARHERDFKSADWKDWIARQRTAVENAAAAARAKAREDEAAARAKAVESLTQPAPPPLPPKPAADAAEAARIEEFLDQAEKLAAQRQYEKIEPGAPKFPAHAELKAHLDFFRAAADLVAGARAGSSKQGQSVSFEMRGGQKVSGGVEASDGVSLLVGGKAYPVHDMAGPSLAAFYRQAKQSAARPEALVAIALFDANLAAADAVLKSSPLTLPSRLARIHGRMTAERDADLLLKEAAKLKDDAATAKLSAIVEKHPETKAGEAARKRLEAMAKEVVVYAADLGRDQMSSGFGFLEADASPGGKAAGTEDDSEGYAEPPEES
jgi:serine/threonine-protein kinase